jgi:hypothetical protein
MAAPTKPGSRSAPFVQIDEHVGSSSNARRITIDSTDYVLVGDVRYRVVLADLPLSPYYSSWEDGPMLNRRRGRAIDCLIAAEWTPSAPRRSSCFTAQVDATGAISGVAPTEARFAGDATLDRCTRSVVASLDLGPTRSGTGGPIRVCVDAYLSR